MNTFRKLAKWRKRTRKLEQKNTRRGLLDWEEKLYHKLLIKLDEYRVYSKQTAYSIFTPLYGE
jgi:hypothetical protein